MAQTMPFREVVEAVDQLSLDEQETLFSILHGRLVEQGRKRIAVEVEEARQEFAEGNCRTATVDDLINEIVS